MYKFWTRYKACVKNQREELFGTGNVSYLKTPTCATVFNLLLTEMCFGLFVYSSSKYTWLTFLFCRLTLFGFPFETILFVKVTFIVIIGFTL